MIEYVKCGRVYVPEKNLNYKGVRPNKEKESMGDLWLGIMLAVIVIICPLVGIFAA